MGYVLIPVAIEKLLLWLGVGTTAAATGVVIAENMNEANKAAGSSQSGTSSYVDACSSCQPPEDEDKEGDESSQKPSNYDKMSAEDKRSVRSLQKQIREHHQKIQDFKNNPTVRPGMENQPADIIAKQHQARLDHLYREIRTFENNIYKINDKYWNMTQ